MIMMIKIKNVSIYKKNNLILKNVNADLRGNVVIIGAHNSGKTKLIEAICGRTKIETGLIELDEKFVKENHLDKRNNGFMYIPKDYHTFLENLKVKHIISFFAKFKEKNSMLLREADITPSLKFKELTPIQKLILFIDIGLKNNKKIFLLDEPLLHLDMYERLIFRKIIDTYLVDCMLIMTSTNPEEEILDFDQKLFIHDGTLVTRNPFPKVYCK